MDSAWVYLGSGFLVTFAGFAFIFVVWGVVRASIWAAEKLVCVALRRKWSARKRDAVFFCIAFFVIGMMCSVYFVFADFLSNL